MKSRTDIMNFIISIESKYPVDTWEINNIKIWPYLRNRLYYYMHSSLENHKRPKKIQLTNGIKNNESRVKRYFNLFYFFLTLRNKEYIFFEAKSHKVKFGNIFVNKYYDIIIDKCNLKNKSYIFDYFDFNKLITISNNDNRKSIVPFSNLFSFVINKFKKIFFRTNNLLFFDKYEGFINELKGVKNLEINKLEFQEHHLKRKFEQLNIKVLFYKYLYRRVKPKQIFMLCYYNSFETYAAIIAANQLSVKTIEMQHGPQTEIQAPYANWTKIPKKGYDMLPRVYWNWDSESKKTIENWSKNSTLYSSVLGGNTWVSYWANSERKIRDKDYILYTLQSLSFELLFPKEVIDTILEGDYLWMIRLHPRQIHQKEALMFFLEEKGVNHKVNLENGTSLPLPLLMKNCLLNITHYSGTVNEAVLMNKISILLDKMGLECFPEFIKQQKAVYIEPSKFSNKIIKSILKSSYTFQKIKETTPFYLTYFK